MMQRVAILIGLMPMIIVRGAEVAPEWYCETICAGGCGGRARYDALEQICRCSISERIDDGDMELINKTARIVNLKIKFYPVKVRRALDERREGERKPFPAFPQQVHLPTLKPLFGDLAARLHGEEDAILGQIDPGLEDLEPHHNVYAAPPAHGKHLFGGPILGYPPMPMLGFGAAAHAYPAHLTPALTRSLLMNVRERLDGLLLRTQQYPYQPAVTAHETESMRNTLKQITQVNVNVRPHGTTWGYFFNNLVNQLAPMLRAEGPQDVDGSPTQAEGVAEKKRHKSGKVAAELGKKTSTKATPKKIESTLVTTTPSTSTTVLKGEDTQSVSPMDQLFTPPHSTKATETTTLRFLPVEEGDDLVGEDYQYDEDHVD